MSTPDTTIDNPSLDMTQPAPVQGQPQPQPVPQAPEPEPTAQEPEENPLDILQPKAAPKTWIIGPQGQQIELVQRPLSLFKKMEFFALVGDVVDRAMSGPNPLTVGNLFSAPGMENGALRAEDFRDADTFIQAIGKLVSYMPDFMERSFCIWLNVPDYRRELVIEMMSAPQEEGGLSDEDGLEIIEIFIDQNYDAIQNIFGNKMGKLRKRIEARQKGVAR